MPSPLSAEEFRKIDAYWRAANYLSVGQIYLYNNPLLTEPSGRASEWGRTPVLQRVSRPAVRD